MDLLVSTSLYQLFFALILLVIIYFVTLQMLKIGSIVVYPTYTVKAKEEQVIVQGKATNGARFNTIFPFSKNGAAFRKIPRSVNGTTGAQFTYQFWAKVNDTNPENFKNLIVLLKGDDRLFKVGYYDRETNRKIEFENVTPKHMIKCPLIKFGNSYKNLSVEFNTNNHPDVKINVNLEEGSEEHKRRNLLSLLPVEMVMFTFVFQENFSKYEGVENGIKFTMYINDVPFYTESASTNPLLRHNFLKQNDGDIYILPNVKNQGALDVANIKYFNYALTDSDVIASFNKGRPGKGNPASLYYN